VAAQAEMASARATAARLKGFTLKAVIRFPN
jgi:hypothetical protein